MPKTEKKLSKAVSDSINYRELTPVQNVEGLWLKREDLFCPFGEGGVNGGKLRQCFALVDSIRNKGYTGGVITYCSIHSPQGPITSAVCRYYGLNCVIGYGGTSPKSLCSSPMPRLVMGYGARIKILSHTGRHNVLKKRAIDLAQKENRFVVEYGFNLSEHKDLLVLAIAEQVKNIPDSLDNLIITCGSGITSAGVLAGIAIHGKQVKNVHLVCTAPDRTELINSILSGMNLKPECNIYRHDLYNSPGFVYEKGVNASFHGVKLHPNYEAKTFAWLVKKSGIDIHNGRNLLWIVGSEPYR